MAYSQPSMPIIQSQIPKFQNKPSSIHNNQPMPNKTNITNQQPNPIPTISSTFP